MKILVTPTSLNSQSNMKAIEILKNFSHDLVFNTTGKPLSEEQLIPLIKDCDGYLAGLDAITERVLKEASRLKIISRYGAGYDNIDMKAAHSRGIIVTNTPGANAEAVGELAFGLILSVVRRIPALYAETKSGRWPRSTGVELAGKTLGIIGLGAIGKVVARCAAGFSMTICAYDPFADESYASSHHIQMCSLPQLLSQADVISLHLPLSASTRHLINKDTISQMKDGVILINASRGGIINEADVLEALKSGKVGGLGLDAFETEPPVGSPLLELDNVIATPHTGAHTKEASENMAQLAVANLISVLTGKGCPYIIS